MTTEQQPQHPGPPSDNDSGFEVPCCACGDPVGLVAINGTKDTYAETACGRCGRPLCDGCSDDSDWQCDGSRCCPECCSYFAQEALQSDTEDK